jgi:hypothetical protein
MKPFRAAQLSAAIVATLARPLLSGETMWIQGMRDRHAHARKPHRRGGLAPLQQAR